jgi:hypothetical protein
VATHVSGGLTHAGSNRDVLVMPTEGFTIFVVFLDALASKFLSLRDLRRGHMFFKGISVFSTALVSISS